MKISPALARTRFLGALAAALLLSGPTVVACDAPGSGTALATSTAPVTARVESASPVGDICYTDLPTQAHETLDLIEEGGPFPYPQDGTTFHNREGLLPSQPTGYYSEYTVRTPGSPDRGARRIVTGEAKQEDYYTADHYRSFDLVDHGC